MQKIYDLLKLILNAVGAFFIYSAGKDAERNKANEQEGKAKRQADKVHNDRNDDSILDELRKRWKK
jgi:hypothetical protein